MNDLLKQADRKALNINELCNYNDVSDSLIGTITSAKGCLGTLGYSMQMDGGRFRELKYDDVGMAAHNAQRLMEEAQAIFTRLMEVHDSGSEIEAA